MTLTVGSLFSGIGGLDLGLERAGMRVIWQSEIDPYASRVLAAHWPEVLNHGDITRINWGDIVRPDILCGGYPCQPFSTAGHRQGEHDPRHLWPWVRDAISRLRPRYAILENVRGHLSLGGLSVIGDLASLGYDAEWRVVSAASVGAPHRRDRVFIVAYPQPSGLERFRPDSRQAQVSEPGNDGASMAYTSGSHARNTQPHRLPTIFGQAAELREPPSMARSIIDWWETEPDVGRVANGIPARVDRLRGLGNAVVPQVAEVIGRLVIEHHNRTEAAGE